jgi:hypothetical protein
MARSSPLTVIPAKAGIQHRCPFSDENRKNWTPAFAGVTKIEVGTS